MRYPLILSSSNIVIFNSCNFVGYSIFSKPLISCVYWWQLNVMVVSSVLSTGVEVLLMGISHTMPYILRVLLVKYKKWVLKWNSKLSCNSFIHKTHTRTKRNACGHPMSFFILRYSSQSKMTNSLLGQNWLLSLTGINIA